MSKLIGHAKWKIAALRRIAKKIDSLASELEELLDLQTSAAELYVQTDNGADVPLPGDGASDKTCPACGGKGVSGWAVDPRPCHICNGKGHLSD